MNTADQLLHFTDPEKEFFSAQLVTRKKKSKYNGIRIPLARRRMVSTSCLEGRSAGGQDAGQLNTLVLLNTRIFPLKCKPHPTGRVSNYLQSKAPNGYAFFGK